MATQPEKPGLTARLSSALKRARESGVELLTLVFPPLPASAFAQITRASAELCFFFENREKRLAELALNFCGQELFACENVQLETLREQFPKNRLSLSLSEKFDLPAEPKIFFAGTFEKTAKNFAAIPRWQLSRDEEKTSVRACVFPQREKELSARALRREFERLEKLASPASASGVPARPKIVELHDDEGAPGARLDSIERALTTVCAGKLRKIVLAHKRDFLLKNASKKRPAIPPIIAALRERFLGNNCTIFCARAAPQNASGSTPFILGATPEMLARIRGGRLETEAVAGTAKNDGDAHFDAKNLLLDDPKERREHRFVVDFILQKLRENAMEPHFCAEPEILKLPNVFHLRTEISADLPAASMDAGKIAALLHPTPAMCGLPVENAEKYIRRQEAFPRENFASPVGFLDPSGEGFFAVAIRCAKISGKTVRLYAASGLVSESVPEKECAEVDAKFSAILSAFECVAGTPE